MAAQRDSSLVHFILTLHWHVYCQYLKSESTSHKATGHKSKGVGFWSSVGIFIAEVIKSLSYISILIGFVFNGASWKLRGITKFWRLSDAVYTLIFRPSQMKHNHRERNRAIFDFWLKDGGPTSHRETGCHWLLTVPESWDDHLTVWLLLRPVIAEMTLMLVCSCAFLCVWCRFTYITDPWFRLRLRPAICTQLSVVPRFITA